MSEPTWLPVELVVAIHDEQLVIFGGAAGLRDQGALESALGRPQNKWGYENQQDHAVLAAAYAFGLAKNHPFVDGNKRTAFLSAVTYLGLNGIDLAVEEAEVVVIMQALAAGEVDEAGFARWIGDNIK